MNSMQAFIIFDPQSNGSTLRQRLEDELTGRSFGKWQALVKRGLHTINHHLYQIVYIQPGIMSPIERADSKIFKNCNFRMPTFAI